MASGDAVWSAGRDGFAAGGDMLPRVPEQGRGWGDQMSLGVFAPVTAIAAIGVVDSEPNIRNKLSRGKFTAVFLVQCLEAIGSSSLRLAD